ncbi:MAG: MFS transporter [Dehalococcoidia bacterium]|nr:MFS transporter [Dehalococcoidia bacterium]
MLKLSLGQGMRSIGVHWHYAWLIVVMATVLQVSTNFISQAFSILLVKLQDDFGWTLTAITLAYFLRSITGALLSPVAGWIGDRYGARKALLVGATLYVVGMFLLSSIQQVWQLYIYYSFILGIAQAMFMVNIPTTVAAWFQRRLGIAVGLQQSAGGMGASVMAPALAFILVRVEWETAFWGIAAVGGIIIFSLLSQFRSQPADKAMQPYGASEGDPPPRPADDPSVTKIRSRVFMQHARRTRAFWNLIAIHHLGCIGHSTVMVGVVFFAHTVHGMSLEAAALIVSIYSFFSIASRFATPVLADRWGAKGVMALAYFIQGITVALLFWTQDPWQFYLFAALFGIGLGGEMSAFLVINRQYYGMGPVRTIYGFQSLGAGLGMALGGLIGSVVFDVFGAYDIAWGISIAASLGGAACILILESTSRTLIGGWENSLPPEARSSSSPA